MPRSSSAKLGDFNILDYCNYSSDTIILESLSISKLLPSFYNSLSLRSYLHSQMNLLPFIYTFVSFFCYQ